MTNLITHSEDANWLHKAKKQGVLNRLTDILLVLRIQEGVPAKVIADTFKLNVFSLHNHLSLFSASQLRLREERVILSFTSHKPSDSVPKYAGLIPLRLVHAVRPSLMSEHFGVSEGLLRAYFTREGVEEELQKRQQEKSESALVKAVEEGLLPQGFLP